MRFIQRGYDARLDNPSQGRDVAGGAAGSAGFAQDLASRGGISRTWFSGLSNPKQKVREIIRKNVRSGKSGRKQLDAVKRIIRDAGYVCTQEERASDVPGIEVNIGMHGMGNIAHDVAAGLAEFQPELIELEIRPNALLALEFRVFVPADEWNGKKIPVAIEENGLITDRGLEWLHPPQNRVP